MDTIEGICKYCKGDIVKVVPRYWTDASFWRHVKAPALPHKAKPE
jgi:hypothetical protein